MYRLTLTKDNFDSVIKSHSIVVINFWATWCEPCKNFSLIYDEVAKQQDHAIFGSVNVDEEKALAEEFSIQSIPFVMLIKDQTIVYAESGVLTEAALSDLVDQAGVLDINGER